MTCKGICHRYKASKPKGMGRYASGQKRCQICEIYIEWEGLWCPCCRYRLRCKPRNVTYKEKLKNTDFKAGAVVRLYKDWKKCEDFECEAMLIKLIIPIVKKVGAVWLVRHLNNNITEKRIINITEKDKVLVS